MYLYLWLILHFLIPVSSVVPGINNAGFQLFNKIHTENANSIYSPYSVGSGLHSLLLGAGGSTHTRLSQLLQSPLHSHLQIEKINNILVKATEQCTLRISNKIFHHHDTKLADEFEALSQRHFNAGVVGVNFKDEKLDQVIAQINSQVESETNGKISNLLSKDVITEDTRLVLVNVVYFKAVWRNKFKKHNTRDRPFYISQNKHVMVPTMQLTHTIRYLDDERFQSAVLEFRDTGVEMVVYKPKQDLAALLSTLLTQGEIERSYELMKYEEVELNIPKFTVNNKYKLKRALISLGLKDLFEDFHADFSKMTASGKRELTLSEVLHNTFISLNEEGCEAAAATASVMRLTRSAPLGPEPIKLHLDVPFVYTLRDRATGVILFLGTQTHFTGTVFDRTEL